MKSVSDGFYVRTCTLYVEALQRRRRELECRTLGVPMFGFDDAKAFLKVSTARIRAEIRELEYCLAAAVKRLDGIRGRATESKED